MASPQASPQALAHARLMIAISGIMHEVLSLMDSPHWQRVPAALQDMAREILDQAEAMESLAAMVMYDQEEVSDGRQVEAREAGR